MNDSINDSKISTEETARRSGRLYRVSGSLLICKTTSRTIPHNFVGSSRSGVHEFSAGSAVRMRRYIRECMAEYQNMVTLTYPGFFESDGAIVKDHLRRYLQELKRKIERENPHDVLRYSTFWFLEFQERGAPHFHLFTTHYASKDWVSKTWYRIVNSEDPRHLVAGTRCEKLERGRSGLISYATKYACKQCQKVVPKDYENVGRFWGVSGYRATMSADTFVSRDDRRDPGVRHSEKKLFQEVEAGIEEGVITEFKKVPGECAVYVLLNNQIWRRLMLKVSILSAKTMKVPQLFQDAALNIEDERYGIY